MRTALTRMLNLEAPICAFSHCRDVVVEVSRAGGLGVLGTSRYSPEQLDIELSRIDDALQGRPYGVSIIFPSSKLDGEEPDSAALASLIPEEHRLFVQSLAERF